MAQLQSHWLADHAVNNSKMDNTDHYVIGSVDSGDGTFTGNITITQDANRPALDMTRNNGLNTLPVVNIYNSSTSTGSVLINLEGANSINSPSIAIKNKGSSGIGLGITTDGDNNGVVTTDSDLTLQTPSNLSLNPTEMLNLNGGNIHLNTGGFLLVDSGSLQIATGPVSLTMGNITSPGTVNLEADSITLASLNTINLSYEENLSINSASFGACAEFHANGSIEAKSDMTVHGHLSLVGGVSNDLVAHKDATVEGKLIVIGDMTANGHVSHSRNTDSQLRSESDIIMVEPFGDIGVSLINDSVHVENSSGNVRIYPMGSNHYGLQINATTAPSEALVLDYPSSTFNRDLQINGDLNTTGDASTSGTASIIGNVSVGKPFDNPARMVDVTTAGSPYKIGILATSEGYSAIQGNCYGPEPSIASFASDIGVSIQAGWNNTSGDSTGLRIAVSTPVGNIIEGYNGTIGNNPTKVFSVSKQGDVTCNSLNILGALLPWNSLSGFTISVTENPSTYMDSLITVQAGQCTNHDNTKVILNRTAFVKRAIIAGMGSSSTLDYWSVGSGQGCVWGGTSSVSFFPEFRWFNVYALSNAQGDFDVGIAPYNVGDVHEMFSNFPYYRRIGSIHAFCTLFGFPIKINYSFRPFVQKGDLFGYKEQESGTISGVTGLGFHDFTSYSLFSVPPVEGIVANISIKADKVCNPLYIVPEYYTKQGEFTDIGLTDNSGNGHYQVLCTPVVHAPDSTTANIKVRISGGSPSLVNIYPTSYYDYRGKL